MRVQRGGESWQERRGGNTGILRREAAPGEPGPGSGPVRMELSEVQAQRGKARAGGWAGAVSEAAEPDLQHGLCSQFSGTPFEGLGRGGNVI